MLHTIQELTSCSVLSSRRNRQEPLVMLRASIAVLRHLQHDLYLHATVFTSMKNIFQNVKGCRDGSAKNHTN